MAAEVEACADATDELRHALVDAAARVVARQGYDGTKLQDIVREAGLSTGAVYGRFRSKDELLREALMTRSIPSSCSVPPEHTKVADLVTSLAMQTDAELTDAEALLLETFVTARRQAEVSSPQPLASGTALSPHWSRSRRATGPSTRPSTRAPSSSSSGCSSSGCSSTVAQAYRHRTPKGGTRSCSGSSRASATRIPRTT